MDKIKTLIITQALGYGIGGSEKALIEMLKAIDTSVYEVTVLSLSEAPDKPYCDDRMRIIYGCADFLKAHAPFSIVMKSGAYSIKYKFLKLYASLYTRYVKGDYSKTLWNIYKQQIGYEPLKYDLAIGYGVGFATYYVVDKVHAKMKIGWLNTSLADAHLDLDFCRNYYEKVDVVIADSESGAKRFSDLYKNFSKPVRSVRNLLDYSELREKASENKGFTDDYDGVRILSVGRLTEAKAFHLAVDAAKALKDKGYRFRWYIIGFGSLEKSLQQQIKDNELEGTFVLLGAQANPYPFFKECDIYVQTSIFEGSCITIEEAMAFYRPIVSTNFPAAYEKVVDGKNGIITLMEAQSIACGVEKLLNNTVLRDEFIEYQMKHPLSYAEEMGKFYKIVQEGLIKA